MAGIDISNLQTCMGDALQAWVDDNGKRADKGVQQAELFERLEAVQDTIPPLYRETVFNPFMLSLRSLSAEDFKRILKDDKSRTGLGRALLDVAYAILQIGEKSETQRATRSFQEVVSDLYDGFLSAEDRRGVKRPDLSVIAPLVKWGNPDIGPYILPLDEHTDALGIKVAIVNMPPAYATLGLLAWTMLGHETAGHGIINADNGLQDEMAYVVWEKLEKVGIDKHVTNYWADKVHEAAPDVLGILNMGPASAIGYIGYFRSLHAFETNGDFTLSNIGGAEDKHPADILRGFLGAATVRLLSFDDAESWANVLLEQTEKDVTTIKLGGKIVDPYEAKRSADLVAEILVQTKFDRLENHSLLEIQDWRNADEAIAKQMGSLLIRESPLADNYSEGTYAAHVVAGATMAALTKGGNVPLVFKRMLSVLEIMHTNNPSWSRFFVVHPGDIEVHPVIDPHRLRNARLRYRRRK